MIIYFSGTGNSLYTAGRTADTAGGSLFDMGESMRTGTEPSLGEGEDIVFSLPTYAWRIPRAAERWIRKRRFSGRRAWFMMTCGTDTGAASIYNERLCRDCSMEYMGTMTVVMPENYVALFPVPERDEALKIIEDADPVIDAGALLVKEGRPFPEEGTGAADRIKSGVVNDLFYPMFVKDSLFTAGDGCISCGLCERLCPFGNIEMRDGRPVWGGECTQCMACICRCPAGAIEYGRRSRGRPRYTCPL